MCKRENISNVKANAALLAVVFQVVSGMARISARWGKVTQNKKRAEFFILGNREPGVMSD